MDYSELHQTFLKSSGVSTDTREDLQNKIFFALKGPNFNGNQYAQLALDKGAIAVVGDEQSVDDSRLILVNDSLKCLQGLANYHRKQHSAKFISITGSNGKTTTKELLLSILSQQFKTQATKGNLNNHIGVPLSLLAIRQETEMAIIEMGANHPKEIAFLCEIAEPEYGLITNIGKAHLEGFGSIEGVDQSKRELFDFIEKNKGQIFLNNNDAFLVKQKGNYTNESHYGNGCDYNILIQAEKAKLNLEFDLELKGQSISASSALFGMYNAENILAAATVAYHFNMGLEAIKNGIEAYIPSNSRSQVSSSAKNTLILDAYNANPSSVEKAIHELAKIKAGKKLAIIGAMKEGGENSDQAHKNISLLLEELGIENILIGGEFEAHGNDKCLGYFNNTSKLMQGELLDDIRDYTILVKGSRSVGLEKLVPYL